MTVCCEKCGFYIKPVVLSDSVNLYTDYQWMIKKGMRVAICGNVKAEDYGKIVVYDNICNEWVSK